MPRPTRPDDVILAFTRFRMGTAANPPPVIALRLTDDFFQAVRRDLTGGETSLGDLQLVGLRLNDLYTNDLYTGALSQTLDRLAAEHQWTPPWSGYERHLGLPPASAPRP